VEREGDSAESHLSLSCLVSLLVYLNAAKSSTAVGTKALQGTAKLMKKKTDERKNPKAGKCSKCGETVGVGWGHAQHVKICRKVRPAKLDNYPATTNGFHTPAAPNTLTDATCDTDNACGGDDNLDTQNGNQWWDNDLETTVLHNGTSSVSSYLTSLTDVDPHHICECVDWGCNEYYWALQSPREEEEYLQNIN
jgi:hypothetical protein